MKTMLNNKPGKKGLLEGLVYGEDEENMMASATCSVTLFSFCRGLVILLGI